MGKGIDIKVIATTSFAIIAVVTLLAITGFIASGLEILIQVGWRLGVTVIIGGIAIAISKAYMDDFYKFIGIIICLIIIVGIWWSIG